MRSCLTFFHTHSSGFSSGEYAGRENNCSLPLVEATNSLVALERWTGWPSMTRNTDQGVGQQPAKSMNLGVQLAVDAREP